MFQRILVAIDGSATANRGLKAAFELARDEHASVDILHVVDGAAMVPYMSDTGYIPGDYLDRFVEEAREKGRKVLAKAEKQAAEMAIKARGVLVETAGTSVAQVILEQARKLRSDVIVLGTHGRRGLRRIVMGSDAEAVLREAKVPVLLVRAPEPSSRPVRASGTATKPRKRASTKALK